MEPWRLAPGEGARVAVVGGSGRVGSAIVAALMATGAMVAVLDLPGSLATCPPAGGVRAIPLDASDPASVAVAFAGLADWRALDACVVLAGFATRCCTETSRTAHGWEAMVSDNLRGAFMVARGALPLLRHGREPALVLTAAELGECAAPAFSPYAAAKAGVIALTRSLALEAAPLIRVNCVAPGAIQAGLSESKPETALPRPRPVMMESHAETVPLRRLAIVEDVAGPVLFLLGPAARYITGQTLHVDGGLVMA